MKTRMLLGLIVIFGWSLAVAQDATVTRGASPPATAPPPLSNYEKILLKPAPEGVPPVIWIQSRLKSSDPTDIYMEWKDEPGCHAYSTGRDSGVWNEGLPVALRKRFGSTVPDGQLRRNDTVLDLSICPPPSKWAPFRQGIRVMTLGTGMVARDVAYFNDVIAPAMIELNDKLEGNDPSLPPDIRNAAGRIHDASTKNNKALLDKHLQRLDRASQPRVPAKK